MARMLRVGHGDLFHSLIWHTSSQGGPDMAFLFSHIVPVHDHFQLGLTRCLTPFSHSSIV